jgi:hypothetical protein
LEWCRIARGSGQPGDFDVPVIVDFAAFARAARRRPIGIGAIAVHGAAPTDHNIPAHCPPAHDENSDISAHCSPAYDEDSDALAGAALGGPSVMAESAICSRRERVIRMNEKPTFDQYHPGGVAQQSLDWKARVPACSRQ